MANVYHEVLTTSDGIHIAYAISVADAAARTAYSYSVGDEGKVIRQEDDDSFYILQDFAGPTFLKIGDAQSIQSNAVESGTPANGDLLTWSTANSQWEHQAPADPAVGGDLSGTASSATVNKIQGETILGAASTDAQILIYDGPNSRWERHALTGDITVLNTGAVKVTKIQSRNVQDIGPSDGDVLTWSTSNARWEPQESAGGDATSIQSTPVDAAAPTDAQVFIYDGSVDNEWEPKSLSGDVTITRDGVASVANHLPLSGGTMTGDIDVGSQDVINIGGMEIPNVTAFGSLPAAASHAGNFYAIYDATGNDTYALVFSNGTTWEYVTQAYNADYEITNTMKFSETEGRLQLPVFNTAPSGPLAAEIFYEAGDDLLYYYADGIASNVLIASAEAVEIPTATSSAGLPSASTHAGNFAAVINTAGDDTYALFLSNGTSWEQVTETYNTSREIISTTKWNENEGRLILPAWTSVPSSPTGGEIVYQATDDVLEYYDNTGAAWRKVQTAQKLTFSSNFHSPVANSSNLFYGFRALDGSSTTNFERLTKSYSLSGTQPVVSTAYGNAAGFLVPEDGTLERIRFSAQTGTAGANVTIRISALKVQHDYSGTIANGGSSLLTSASYSFNPSTDGEIITDSLSLANTSLNAGDIIVPVVLMSDRDTANGVFGQFTVTMRVNE